MPDRTELLWALLVAFAITAGVVVYALNVEECRAAGFSWRYCVTK